MIGWKKSGSANPFEGKFIGYNKHAFLTSYKYTFYKNIVNFKSLIHKKNHLK